MTDSNPELSFGLVCLTSLLAILPFFPASVAVPIFIAALIGLTVCKRLVLTHERLLVRRPFLKWLGCGEDELWLESITAVETDGSYLVLRTQGGTIRYWINADAERFASHVQGELRRLEREALKQKIQHVKRSITVRFHPATRCPFCHDDLALVEVVCNGCETGYHAECFGAHGRCSILGCGQTAARRAA